MPKHKTHFGGEKPYFDNFDFLVTLSKEIQELIRKVSAVWKGESMVL